jgi:hypothetical protein
LKDYHADTCHYSPKPTKETKAIYDMLKDKYAPFTRKKSVGTPTEIYKNDSS